MKPREFFWLVGYSFKAAYDEIISLFKQLRNPSAWVWIWIGIFLYSIYYKKYNMIWILLPMVLIIIIGTNKQTGDYKRVLFQRDLKKNIDSTVVKEYYERYLKDCTYAKKVPLPFNEWKAKELLEMKDEKEN